MVYQSRDNYETFNLVSKIGLLIIIIIVTEPHREKKTEMKHVCTFVARKSEGALKFESSIFKKICEFKHKMTLLRMSGADASLNISAHSNCLF